MSLKRVCGQPCRTIMIAFAAVLALQGCALVEPAHYDIRSDAVYWISYPGTSASPSFDRYERRTEADPQTFEILAFANWGKDARSGYYRGTALAGVDAPSFRAINDELAADDTQVWRGTNLIEGADGASFRTIGPSTGVDRAAAYAGWARFVPCDLSTFTVIESEAESEDEAFTADSACVYAYGLRLPLTDRATFERLGAEYSRDSGGVYWRHFEVAGADPASFHVREGTRLGQDSSGCWLGPDWRECRD
ncbi:DKNYY domain-containing protein [Maricaulis salignorans]|uniref:DKNYY domain-containing protein n=1 Tax=Maricaulis salignorans TaxID=144026 RepID=UPI003A94AC11